MLSKLPKPPDYNEEADVEAEQQKTNFLLTVGFNLHYVCKIVHMSPEARIPLIHRVTNENIPTNERPRNEDIVQFFKTHPEWKLDTDLFSLMDID
ncbi:hypothetical protein CRE_03875 [Caenorhabditis remanei]|uniref:Uncharacterized protein n=1 Tax=Caenorhabditis remanei TaxID=31234 RepID=E3LXK9_CAERE|nr:hypothetical protein CRE_03875 [Caenorhabditis remanei]